MIHAITLLAMLSAPSPNPEAVSSPPVDVSDVRVVPESVWAALVDHRVEVQSSTGEVVRGKLLRYDPTNVVLADDEGGVSAHSKATIVTVRIDEPAPSSELSADNVGPQSETTRHEPVEHAQETPTVSAPECRMDGECGNDGVCRLGACVGMCNTTWDPCGSRSDYRAAKRAADMRITAGIAVVAAGTGFVISGIAMAIVGSVRSKRSQRRHATLHPSWEQGAPGPQWRVRF